MAKQAKRTRKLHASYAAAGRVNEERSRRCRGAVGEGKQSSFRTFGQFCFKYEWMREEGVEQSSESGHFSGSKSFKLLSEIHLSFIFLQ